MLPAVRVSSVGPRPNLLWDPESMPLGFWVAGHGTAGTSFLRTTLQTTRSSRVSRAVITLPRAVRRLPRCRECPESSTDPGQFRCRVAPNPIVDAVRTSFNLLVGGRTQVLSIDPAGRRAHTVTDAELPGGPHELSRRLPAGVSPAEGS